MTSCNLTILLIAAAFTLLSYPAPADQPVAGFSEFQYEITSCSRSTELKDNSIKITAIGNSINFSQTLNTYCNINRDNLILKYNKAVSMLEVIESLEPTTVSRCVCPLKIVGKIDNLENGLYKVKFLLDNKYTNQKETIASQEIEIKHK